MCLLFAACSDVKQPVATNRPSELSVHPEGWLDSTSVDFHGLFIRESQWDLQNCRECHGGDYTGGITEVSCLTCHPNTPEDCVVCHGGTDDLSGAPPEDLDGNVSVTARGVGAHTVHLKGDSLASGFACESCHLVPSRFDTTGHADSDLPAEVTFAAFAFTDSANPQYDAVNLSCSNIYCHGAWDLAKSESNWAFIYTAERIEGSRAQPVWTDPASGSCGTCHGLPPKGHSPRTLTECGGCHFAVAPDGSIADKSKHINGMVNVFGQEYPVF